MSTIESRAHDAWVDAHTIHGDCGQTLDRCDCTDETLPDPDTLNPRTARLYARACALVAATIRDQLPHASATRVAEYLEQRAGSYADRADEEDQ